jgi:hypothetical protein
MTRADNVPGGGPTTYFETHSAPDYNFARGGQGRWEGTDKFMFSILLPSKMTELDPAWKSCDFAPYLAIKELFTLKPVEPTAIANTMGRSLSTHSAIPKATITRWVPRETARFLQ